MSVRVDDEDEADEDLLLLLFVVVLGDDVLVATVTDDGLGEVCDCGWLLACTN